jgi:hypothetical protein
MTNTFRALGIAASLLMGTALAASAAVTGDNQGNTAPSGSVQPGTPGYTTSTTPGYQTTQSSPSPSATMTPHLNRGSGEDAAGGAGGGGGAGGAGGGAGGR